MMKLTPDLNVGDRVKGKIIARIDRAKKTRIEYHDESADYATDKTEWWVDEPTSEKWPTK